MAFGVEQKWILILDQLPIFSEPGCRHALSVQQIFAEQNSKIFILSTFYFFGIK